MAALKIILNGLLMALEIAAVAAVCWFGWRYPFIFAAVTAALALVMGLWLEHKRLAHELPFYFEGGQTRRFRFTIFVGAAEAFVKSIIAGVAALFTFSGTDEQRLMWVAITFGITIYVGAAVLRWLSLSFQATPGRWGYFRLAAPLGLLFSAGMVVLGALDIIKSASIADMGWRIIWELPAKPSVEQVSELFFGLKQAFDNFVLQLLSGFMSETWAQIASVAISVNVLTGTIAALYASVITSFVRHAERKLF